MLLNMQPGVPEAQTSSRGWEAQKTALEEANSLQQSALDALSSHIAILDAHGAILEVNAAWNRFAAENNAISSQCGVGANYLKVCDSACGRSSVGASAMAEGIRAVMAGQREEFLLEYPCYSPQEERWFIARATRFDGEGPARVVVAHDNITGRKRAEKALQETQEKLAHAMNLARLVDWEYDVAGGIFVFSDRYYALHGTTSQLEGGDLMSSKAFVGKFVHPDDAHMVGEEIARAVATADPDYHSRVETRILCQNGEVRTVAVHIAITKDASGRTVRLRGANQDITERKKTDQELRKLWRAVEQSPASIIITDLQGGIEYVNPKFCALTGYSLEEVSGKNPRVLKSGEMPVESYRQMWATITAGEEWRGEFHNRKKNGELYWESAFISPIRDDKGNVTNFVAIKEDITERKRAAETLQRTERELAESARRQKAILDTAPDHIWMRDRNGRFLAVNRQWCDFAGVKESEMLGKTLAELPNIYPAELVKRLQAEDEAVMSSGKISHKDLQLTSASFDTVWLESCKAPLLNEQGVPCGVVGTGRDITKRKQTEEELRRKTAFLETQVNNSIDGILVVDENNRKILQNQRVNDLFKIPKNIAEDKNDEVQRRWVSQAAQKPEEFNARILYFKSHMDEIMRDELEMKDGTILDRYTSPLVGRDGKYYGRMWTFRDITERKRVELAAAQLAAIVQSSDAAIIGESLEGIITSWNAAAEKVFGYSAYEILGQPIMRLVPPDRAQEETENLERIRSGGHASQLETVRLRQDGSPVDVSIASSAIKDTAGKAVGASKIVRDITEIKRTRSEMENLERKEAEHKLAEEHSSRALKHEKELNQIKSQFVSMVSHEFRTPLCVINTAASLLEDYSDKMTGQERTENTREIERAVDRMAQMMEDLLVHEKLQTGKMECKPLLLDMEAFCRELISEISKQPGAERLIECAIDPSAREAFLDKRILRHILCNLLGNAVKYSQGNQFVTLEVKRLAGQAQTGSDRKTPPGDHIQLLVRDTGIGIPAADLAKLFQTFHRAGNVGNRPGTGMGLAIVKKFVDLHRGTIRIESTEGKGTSVWVALPIDSSEVGRQPSSVESESAEVGAG